MSRPVKETDCTRCIKRDVCKYKNDFLRAQDQIWGANIMLDDGSIKELKDFEFISPVTLRCNCRFSEFSLQSTNPLDDDDNYIGGVC